MAKAIIASPFLLPPTQLSYALASELEKVFREYGWEVVRLSGPQNLRVIFSFVLKTHPDATIIAYLGHASPTAFLGEEVFGPGMFAVDNVAEGKERIIVGMPACLSAQRLGPTSVLAGAKAFVGSKEEMYAQFSEAERNYTSDWFDYTLTFYRSLIASLNARRSPEEALEKALRDYREKCTYYIELYKQNMDRLPNADFYAHAVRQNRDYVVGFIR